MPEQYSQELNKLIKLLLDKNQESRPKINEILKYPIVRTTIQDIIRTEIFGQDITKIL